VALRIAEPAAATPAAAVAIIVVVIAAARPAAARATTVVVVIVAHEATAIVSLAFIARVSCLKSLKGWMTQHRWRRGQSRSAWR
jgi:hypothetical protein